MPWVTKGHGPREGRDNQTDDEPIAPNLCGHRDHPRSERNADGARRERTSGPREWPERPGPFGPSDLARSGHFTIIAERASETTGISKVLEGGNLKLASVVTDILGKSGRAGRSALYTSGSVGLQGYRRGRFGVAARTYRFRTRARLLCPGHPPGQ